MASKPKSKKIVTRGVTDANWSSGTTGVSSSFSASALRAIDKTLSPADAYNLSIDLRAAINARNEPLSQGKIRLFYKKSGDEIVGGDLYDLVCNPCPSMSQHAFIYELGSWWDLAGEMVVGSIVDSSGMVNGIYPLNPFKLSVMKPLPARHLAAVQQWRYSWDDGVQVTYDAKSVVVMKNFNPYSNVRGTPPVLAGVNEISSGYEAMAYNRRFFSNNAEPSHIVNLPNITDPAQLEAFKSEYISNYSIRSGNSHKVMFVAGSDVNIEQISETVKEASYIGLQTLTSDRVMRLYKVPPIHGGLWDKAKFDSVGEQNKVFAETVLMPAAERMSQFLQMVVDRFYSSGKVVSQAPKRLSRNIELSLDKAKAERVDSGIIVIIDIDHLPIISELKSQKLLYAQQLQSTFKITPLQAAEEVGMDVEENEANSKVWVTSTESPYIESTEVKSEPVVEVELPDESEIPQEDQAVLDEKKVSGRKFIVAYRKLVLGCVSEGRVFKLAEADALNTDKFSGIKEQIRADYIAIKGMLTAGGETTSTVKSYLNKAYNRQFIKSL